VRERGAGRALALGRHGLTGYFGAMIARIVSMRDSGLNGLVR
jgi:hypothetical protein